MRLLAALVCVASAERAPVCFTAHGQAELHCTHPPARGPLTLYDDAFTAWTFGTRGRTFHLRGNKNLLCETPRCERCLRPGGEMGSCKRSLSRWTLVRMRANEDLPRSRAILFSAAVVLTVVAVLVEALLGSARAARAAARAAAQQGADLKMRAISARDSKGEFETTTWSALKTTSM